MKPSRKVWNTPLTIIFWSCAVKEQKNEKKLQEKGLTEDEILKDFEIFREQLRQGDAAT